MRHIYRVWKITEYIGYEIIRCMYRVREIAKYIGCEKLDRYTGCEKALTTYYNETKEMTIRARVLAKYDDVKWKSYTALYGSIRHKDYGMQGLKRLWGGRKHVKSDSHGFEQIDPTRVLNYCFQ